MTRYTVSPPMLKPFPPSGKIKVTPEESVIVQKRLFQEGFTTAYGGATIRNIECPYIFWNLDKHIQWADERSFFTEDPNQKFTMTLFAPVEVVDDQDEMWDKLIEDYKEDTKCSVFATHTFANWMKKHYKLTKL